MPKSSAHTSTSIYPVHNHELNIINTNLSTPWNPKLHSNTQLINEHKHLNNITFAITLSQTFHSFCPHLKQTCICINIFVTVAECNYTWWYANISRSSVCDDVLPFLPNSRFLVKMTLGSFLHNKHTWFDYFFKSIKEERRLWNDSLGRLC